MQKLEYSMKMMNELHENYLKISKMAYIAFERGLKMIIENPYTQPHFLTTYWCLKPKLIDKDRTLDGDYMKKPTQFFFVNLEPKDNLVFEVLDIVENRVCDKITGKDGKKVQVLRSEIHPQYARRFIKRYILDESEG